jgi:hypothetical protein
VSAAKGAKDNASAARTIAGTCLAPASGSTAAKAVEPASATTKAGWAGST